MLIKYYLKIGSPEMVIREVRGEGRVTDKGIGGRGGRTNQMIEGGGRESVREG